MVGRKSGFRKPLTQFDEEWNEFPLVTPVLFHPSDNRRKLKPLKYALYNKIIDSIGAGNKLGVNAACDWLN